VVQNQSKVPQSNFKSNKTTIDTISLIESSTNNNNNTAKEGNKSHRARGGDPLELDFGVDVGGVAGEREALVPRENHSSGRLHLDHGTSDGDWRKNKNVVNVAY